MSLSLLASVVSGGLTASDPASLRADWRQSPTGLQVAVAEGRVFVTPLQYFGSAWLAPHEAQSEQYLAPTVAGGKVWVSGGYYGGMYGFQQSNGQQLFFQSGLPRNDDWTPSFYAGTLYSWVAGVLRGHERNTGLTQWSTDFGWIAGDGSMNRTSAVANSRAFLMAIPTEPWSTPMTLRTAATAACTSARRGCKANRS